MEITVDGNHKDGTRPPKGWRERESGSSAGEPLEEPEKYGAFPWEGEFHHWMISFYNRGKEHPLYRGGKGVNSIVR